MLVLQILPLSSTERADVRAGVFSLAAAAHVDHVAVTIGGRFVAGTPDWWSLDPGEVLLIQQLLSTQPPALLRDVPLFLPKTSPQVKSLDEQCAPRKPSIVSGCQAPHSKVAESSRVFDERTG